MTAPLFTPIVGYDSRKYNALLEAVDAFFYSNGRKLRVVQWTENPAHKAAIYFHPIDSFGLILSKAKRCLLMGLALALIGEQPSLKGRSFWLVRSLNIAAIGHLFLVAMAFLIKVTSRYVYPVQLASALEKQIDSLDHLAKSDPKKKFELNIHPSDQLLTELAYLVSHVTRNKNAFQQFHRKTSKGTLPGPLYGRPVRWITHNIFLFPDLPEYIFKMGVSAENCLQRFFHAADAEALRAKHGFHRIMIPKAKVLKLTLDNGQNTCILAEQRFEGIIASDSLEEERYYAFAQDPTSDEAIAQFARLLLKKPIYDVERRNFPILPNGNILWVDMEDVDPQFCPIFGMDRLEAAEALMWPSEKQAAAYYPKCLYSGLIRCLCSEKHIHHVVRIWEQEKGPLTEKQSKIIQERLEAIKSYHALQEFYKEKGILKSPKQPIMVYDYANLVNEAADSPFISQDWETEVRRYVQYINKTITDAPSKCSIKAQRYVLISLPREVLKTNALPILEGLRKQGKIFAVDDIFGRYICVQA